jgi:hypothetical protein
MHWPWGTQLTQTQAKETAKYLLNLSQATVFGSVGIFFVQIINFSLSLLLFILGVSLAAFLYLFSMKILKGVK